MDVVAGGRHLVTTRFVAALLAALAFSGCMDATPDGRALDYLVASAPVAGEPPSILGAWAAAAMGEDPTPWLWPDGSTDQGVELPSAGSLYRVGFALGTYGVDVPSMPRDAVREGILNTDDGEQFGSTGSILDDAFAVRALLALGQEMPSDEVIYRSTSMLISEQQTDGGWRYDGAMGSQPDDTGIVLVALHAAGLVTEDVHSGALGYLQDAMQPDGSYHYNNAPNCQSTAWAIVAWDALGESVPDVVVEYLLSCQNPDGGFPTFKGQESSLTATADAAQALGVLY